MVKEVVTITNKSAAGLRRSAIAERIRLHEEWSSLKGTDDEIEPPTKVKKKQNKVFSKNLHNIRIITTKPINSMTNLNTRSNEDCVQRKSSCETLRGVVAFVDVGAESRALALRAALAALGATVAPSWSPIVTHLVWSQGGSRNIRAEARSLACNVVSPLWVEACAASARKISEKVFPSVARDSDLPSPSTLCRLLKKAEKENWPLIGLQTDDEDRQEIRLRISSDTDDNNKSNDGDTTRESLDIEKRVNTAPRRALPVSISPPPANPKSRRKLFTVRADVEHHSDEDSPVHSKKTRPETAPSQPVKAPTCPKKAPPPSGKAPIHTTEPQKKKKYNLTQEQKRNLEKAQRLAKKLASEPAVNRTGHPQTQRRGILSTQRREIANIPRIVLTGMPMSQRQAVISAIHALNGKMQNQVNRRTTHVLLGTCKEDSNNNRNDKSNGETSKTPQMDRRKSQSNKSPKRSISVCNRCNTPEKMIRHVLDNENVTVDNHCSQQIRAWDDNVTIICSSVNRDPNSNNVNNKVTSERHDISDLCDGIVNDKSLRTLKTLFGAVRGCRVLHAKWALDSQKAKKWLPYAGYEVTYLMKVAQKARVERSAFDKIHAEYAYNVFRDMKVIVSEAADKRDAAMQLLTLCGAQIIDDDEAHDNCDDTQNGRILHRATQNGIQSHGGTTQCTQNGGATQNGGGIYQNSDFVIKIGVNENDVSSKWVFDSVVAGRPRTVRRYINKNVP